MNRHLYGMLGALALVFLAGCEHDPTADLLTDTEGVQLSATYTVVLVGDSVQVNARSVDKQGNPLPRFPEVTVTPTDVISKTDDSTQIGKPLQETFVYVRAIGYGEGTVTATDGDKSATLTVQTYPAKVNITSGPDTMASGSTDALTAQAVSSTGDAVVGPTAVTYTWASDANEVIAIDETGAVTAKAPGTAVVSVEVDGGASTSQAIVVEAGDFAGTLNPTTGNPGTLFTVTRATSGPVFDADTRVFFGGAPPVGLETFVDSRTADNLVVAIPATGEAGATAVLLSAMGADQISQIASFTTTASLDDPFWPASDNPFTGPVATNGRHYLVLHDGNTDDFLTIVNNTGAAVSVTAKVGWYTPADIDILWVDENFTAYVGNFDGATSANPETSTVSVPANTTWRLWLNQYEAGSAADNFQLTLSGLP